MIGIWTSSLFQGKPEFKAKGMKQEGRKWADKK